ncbi:MAG TPA: response regulator [Blastococcus sp.]|nr:response regulator [Blastococcus sp.]
MLTALVVDARADSRRRVAGLLRLGGWQVLEAADTDAALRHAASADPDLVVTDMSVPGSSGPSLLRRMRATGSRARFLVVTAEPTDDVRAEALRAGALACLAGPVDARFLLDFLRSRTTGPTAQDSLAEVQDVEDLDDDHLDAELMDRLHETYRDALPGRLSAIARGTTAGDTVAVAFAAHTLAGTSGQLGHPEVASVCQAIAADARRGVLAHARVVQLRALAAV